MAIRLLSPSMPPFRRPLAAAALLSMLLTGTACRKPAAETSAPPIIIISVDTLRSDHLPAYGYRKVQTPAIDALAHDSIVFERAYSHCPLTLPSHATIFTGLLPSETGVRDNLGYRLPAQVSTLASILKEHGYTAGAAVSAYVLRAETGISRGFDFYDDHIPERADQSIGGIQRRGEESASLVEKWIDEHRAQPFLAFLHLYEPHSPYEAPEPYRSRFNPYDAEIAHADAIVGHFLDDLKQKNLYDEAMIVFLSDHGEGLGDHGEDEHGIFLYREAIQVPLMVKLPHSGRHGERVSRPVGLVDIVPAVLDELGLKIPEGLAGRSLLSSSTGPRSIYSESYYARFHFGWSDLHSLTDGSKHYIEAPRPELYDLVADPGEHSNLSMSDRRDFFAMKKAIAPLMKQATQPAAIDPEEASKLAALGYLSGGAETSSGETLPDPKDKTGTFRDLRSSFSLFRAGEYAEALAGFQKILADNPRMTDVWDVTAKAYARLGQTDRAIVAAKKGLETNPHSAALALTVAELSLEVGKLDDAAAHAELALKSDPAPAHELLARIFLARRDFKRAEEEARQAAGEGNRAAALVTWGRTLKEQNRNEEALAKFDAAAGLIATEHKPPYAGLSFLRGDILARLGRANEAEQALRTEIALSPGDARAYQSLIVLLVAQGRPQDATPLVYQLIDRAPTATNFAAIAETMKTLGDINGARYWARRGLAKFPGDARIRKFAG
ncbi:MAG: sulfatase-like hydrolase/transferase [Acidobacteriota bacterium]